MQWHLPYPKVSYSPFVSYAHKGLSVGSCFAQNIANAFGQHYIKLMGNPWGTVYNPISIFTLLSHCVQNKLPFENELVLAHNIWQHPHYPSGYGSENKADVLAKIRDTNTEVKNHLQQSQWLVITLGSAFIYKNNDVVFANCHKIPAGFFTKELLNVHDIVSEFDALYQLLKSQNIRIILTVSPVRHTADGLVENNVSKGILHQSCMHITQNYAMVHYYPAYEIVVDCLRDYRFYNPDLIHPNAQAVNEIWKDFTNQLCTLDTLQYISEVEKYNNFKSHRILNHSPKLISQHNNQLQALLLNLQQKYPSQNFN